MGCDAFECGLRFFRVDFNPRTPYGVRLIRVRVHFFGQNGFQSTHPVWGATPYGVRLENSRQIYPFKFRMGCDPVWGATAVLSKKINDFQISALYFLLRPPKTAFSTRKPPFKPHIRRTLAKRHAQ